MSVADRVRRVQERLLPMCAYCGADAEGNYAIHRDGFGIGPEVDLCDACGSDQTPSCAEIWDQIAKPESA